MCIRDSLNNNNNEILYITAEVERIPAKIMIDTGANISIINANELERIQRECGKTLPMLPVNNICLLYTSYIYIYIYIYHFIRSYQILNPLTLEKNHNMNTKFLYKDELQ